MQKVIIIGCPGSGKSTFGRKLRDIVGLPLYHLDMMYWNEDGTTVSGEIFDFRLQSVMSNPQWIIDGNYARTMEIRLKECDTVFFLDYDTEVCLDGIESRKGKPRSDMPWINGDGTDEEFVDFVTCFNTVNRPEIVRLLDKYSDKNIVAFRSRSEAEIYLKEINKGGN